MGSRCVISKGDEAMVKRFLVIITRFFRVLALGNLKEKALR